MKKLLLAICIFSFSLIVISCEQRTKAETKSTVSDEAIIGADSTIMGTLKGSMKYNLVDEIRNKPIFDAKSYFISKHGDEILRTLEIADTTYIPGVDLYMVFFRYSVGADIIRETTYMKKIDNRWFTYYKYFSSYYDDPFGNGLGSEGKKLLEKGEEWEKSNKAIWWD
ncbi:MAG: hypothetical protein WC756_01070 [Taibaiella sp.]|jgi:hypothetical protein